MRISYAVSLLAAATSDPEQLGRYAARIAAAGAAVHIDVMDGSVTEGVGIDLSIIEMLCATYEVEVHLMLADPAPSVQVVLGAKPARLMVHPDWTPDTAALIEQCRVAGISPWIALGPDSAVTTGDAAALRPDGVLVVAITPGSRTEALRPDTGERVSAMDGPWRLGVDGGVDAGNAGALVRAGATHLVSGRSVLSSPSMATGLAHLRAGAEPVVQR